MGYKQSGIESLTTPSGTRTEVTRILLIEDNPADVRLLREMLFEAKYMRFKIESAGLLTEGLKLLAEKEFDVVLLDLALPDCQGLEVLEKVLVEAPTVPVILLTRTLDEESVAIKALRRGAEDYLFRGNIEGNLLVRSIRYAVERKHLENLEKEKIRLESEIAEHRKRGEAQETLRESLVQLAKKNKYESIISSVTRSIHRSINLQDVLENAVEAIRQNIDDVDNVGIFLVEGEEAVLKAHRGYPDWFSERLSRIPYPKGATWKTIIEGEPLYCADVDQDRVIGPAGRELGIKSYVSMPIHFEGKAAGVIAINSFKKNAFNEEELKLLEIVAQQIETAIDNAKHSEEIRKLNEELEKRVVERTRKLETANKELEAFSYSVSHDLRAPLRAIEGFSSIFLEECSSDLNAEGLRFLNIIRTNVKQMSQLIDDLLAFSRLGRQEIRLSEVKMEQLVRDVFEELKPNTSYRSPEFIIKTLPNAYGDRAMIHQVFINLLSNAIKFTTPKERAVIEVGGWAEGQHNVYYIDDNGVGFDMQYVDKLFGVFQRLHTTGEFEGTGVGLAIVQRIIHKHNGRVWAEGKVGEGATFYFTLPVVGDGPEAES